MFKRRFVVRSLRAVSKRKKKRTIRLIVTCLCVMVFVIGIAYATHLPGVTIAKIEIRGNDTISASAVEAVVEEETKGSYLKLFSKKNTWLYPENNILKTISLEFPQVASVFISSVDKTLSVNITEREPFALWCRDFDKKECFFMDKAGFMYTEAPEFTGPVYLVFTGSVEAENPIGNFYLSKSDFPKIISFIESLKKLKMKPEGVYISSSGDGTVYLPKSEEGEVRKVLFTFGGTLEKAIENLIPFLLEIKLVNSAGSIDVQYIDIRFGNKIFYK